MNAWRWSIISRGWGFTVWGESQLTYMIDIALTVVFRTLAVCSERDARQEGRVPAHPELWNPGWAGRWPLLSGQPRP